MTRKTLNLTGTETIHITGLTDSMKPGADVKVTIQRENGNQEDITLVSRIDTQNEIEYYRHGGILQYVMRNMLKE